MKNNSIQSLRHYKSLYNKAIQTLLKDKPVLIGDKLIASLIPIALSSIITILISMVLTPKNPHFHEIWITSPNHKYYKFPLYQAIRIVRKHNNWTFAKVEPIKQPITKRQAFKILLGIK